LSMAGGAMAIGASAPKREDRQKTIQSAPSASAGINSFDGRVVGKFMTDPQE
jgi:hypothetical protein